MEHGWERFDQLVYSRRRRTGTRRRGTRSFSDHPRARAPSVGLGIRLRFGRPWPACRPMPFRGNEDNGNGDDEGRAHQDDRYEREGPAHDCDEGIWWHCSTHLGEHGSPCDGSDAECAEQKPVFAGPQSEFADKGAVPRARSQGRGTARLGAASDERPVRSGRRPGVPTQSVRGPVWRHPNSGAAGQR